MTDDASPENLRKFLESDDPAMVRMGISMAKGAGVEVTVEDLEHFLESKDVETIETGIMLAYEAGIGDEAMEMLCELLENEFCEGTIEALGSDSRAVEPLIETLDVIDMIEFFRQYRQWCPGVGKWQLDGAVEALATIGDKRAIAPLARVLKSDNLWFYHGDGRVDYHGLFTLPIVEALVRLGITSEEYTAESAVVGEHLNIMFHIVSEEEEMVNLIEHFDTPAFEVDRITELICEIGPAYCEQPPPPWPKAHPNPFCELLIQTLETSDETQQLIRIIEESMGIYSRAAAEALDRLGWRPNTAERRANYLIATEQWDQCSNLGALAVGPLISLIHRSCIYSKVHDYEWIREEQWFEPAVKTLEEIGDPAVAPLIGALENDEDYFRPIVAEVLGRIGDERAEEALSGYDSESVAYWRRIAHPRAVEPLIKALGNEDRDVRESAVRALGEIGDERAVEPLINALSGHDLRESAAEALGKIGDGRAVEPLIKALGDENESFRRAAAWALGRESALNFAILGSSYPELEEGDLENALVKALGDEDKYILREVLLILNNLLAGDTNLFPIGFAQLNQDGREEKDGRVIGLLIRSFQEDLEEVRVSAVSALSWLGKPAVEPLINALGDEISAVRLYAAKALGMIGDARAVKPLIRVLGDDDWVFCEATARALGEIGDARAVKPLIKTLEGDGVDVRVGAAWALGEIGDVVAVEPLIKALEDESEKVRVEAASSLGEIRDERAVEPLIKALEDENSNVRRYAMAALDALGWEPDTEQFQLVRLLALSGLRFSDVPIEAQKGLAKHCKLLLSHEKILNLKQEEFAKIVKERNSSLKTIENPCTAEELIELFSGSSSQARWIVACGIVEISCYDSATIDKIYENPINIFWSEISTYTDPIIKADRDQIVKVLKRLPPVLISKIGKGLVAGSNKDSSDTAKKNRKMLSTFFEDPGLAKIMLSGM